MLDWRLGDLQGDRDLPATMGHSTEVGRTGHQHAPTDLLHDFLACESGHHMARN